MDTQIPTFFFLLVVRDNQQPTDSPLSHNADSDPGLLCFARVFIFFRGEGV